MKWLYFFNIYTKKAKNMMLANIELDDRIDKELCRKIHPKFRRTSVVCSTKYQMMWKSFCRDEENSSTSAAATAEAGESEVSNTHFLNRVIDELDFGDSKIFGSSRKRGER